MAQRDRNRRASKPRKNANPTVDSLESRQLLSGDTVKAVTAITEAIEAVDAQTGFAPDSDSGVVAWSSPIEDRINYAQDGNASSGELPVADYSTDGGLAMMTYAAALSAESGLPDLIPVAFNTPGNLDWDQTFRATGTIKNQGTATTTVPFVVQVFAAPELVSTQNALSAGTFTVPAGLAPGASYNFDVELSTPGRPSAAFAGRASYYLRLSVDATNTIAESNEANNLSQGYQGVDTTVVMVTPKQPSRLMPAGVSVSSGVLQWGGSMRVTATVRNEGAGDAPPTNARVVIAPYGEDPFGPRGYTIGSVPIPAVPGYQTISATQDIRLPQFPPTQLANVGNFVVMIVNDADAKADPVVHPINYLGPGLDWTTAMIAPKATPITPTQLPDLVVNAITTPSTAVWNQKLDVSARIENKGNGNAGTFKVRFTLVQSDDPNAPALVLGDVVVSGLAAGEAQIVTHSVKLPAEVPNGLHPNATAARIIARVDSERVVDENKLDNNRLASLPLALRYDPPPASTPNPPVTTTGNNPTNTPPPTTNNPKPTIPINRRLALQKRQEAAKARREKMLAARAERAQQNRLRIYPRINQLTATRREAQVRVLPFPTTQSDQNPTDQTA